MGASELILILLQGTTVVLLGLLGWALYKALSVWKLLRGRVGGTLSGVIVCVLFAALIAQILAVLSISGALSGVLADINARRVLFFFQQAIVCASLIYAVRKLSRMS